MQILYLILYLFTTSKYYEIGMTKIGITQNILDTYYKYFEPIQEQWHFLGLYNITGTNETLKTVYSNIDHPYEHNLKYNWYKDVLPTSIEHFLIMNNIEFQQIDELRDSELKDSELIFYKTNQKNAIKNKVIFKTEF